jgi:hypothetical protein
MQVYDLAQKAVPFHFVLSSATEAVEEPHPSLCNDAPPSFALSKFDMPLNERRNPLALTGDRLMGVPFH